MSHCTPRSQNQRASSCKHWDLDGSGNGHEVVILKKLVRLGASLVDLVEFTSQSDFVGSPAETFGEQNLFG